MSGVNVSDQDLKTALEKILGDNPGCIRGGDEERLRTSLIMLVNHLNGRGGFNANVTISAEDIETSNKYGTLLAEAFEAVFLPASLCLPVEDVDILYKWNEKHRKSNPETKVLLVKNVTASSESELNNLFKTLTDFEKENWTPSVILCTTNADVEKIKQYDEQDYRLYHYLCGEKIIVPDVNLQNMANLAIKRLEYGGYVPEDSFKDRLGVYIEAVYPEASLAKEPFLDDLIYRIVREHFKKSVEAEKVLDGTDVPYSIKAEALRKERDEAEIKVAEGAESTKDSKCLGNPPKPHQVFLLAMSTFPNKTKKDENGNIIHILAENKPYLRPEKERCFGDINNCRGQLESVAKMRLERISEFSEIDFVIVSTEETDKKYKIEEENPDEYGIKEPKEYSANEYFILRMIDYLNHSLGFNFEPVSKNGVVEYSDDDRKKTVRFNVIMIDENSPLAGMGDTVEKIRRIYSKYKSEERKEKVELWVDTHGGYRDVSVMMTSLLSLLENEGITHDKIYGVHFPKGNDIFEQNEMYDMFDFVTGMNDFFNYGSAYVLKTIREYEKSEDKKELIDAIDLIARGTQFSAPYDYIEGVRNLISYKSRLSPQKPENYKPNKLDIFEENIFNDFGDDILNLNPESEDFDTDIIIAIIERCRKKKLYQQALTFIETLMPKYYYKKKYLYYDTNQNETIEVYKDDNHVKDNENLIFDLNLPKISNFTEKAIIKCFVEKTPSNSPVKKNYMIDGKNLPNKLFKYKDNGGPEVKVDYYNNDSMVYIQSDAENEKKQILGSLFLLHKVLKECRNMFNHGSSDKEERPDVESIDKAIKIYVNTVKYLNEN